MFENPRRGRLARNFTRNVPKILDTKSSSEQIFFRKLSLGALERVLPITSYTANIKIDLVGSIGRFRLFPGPLFQKEGTQPLIWKSFFHSHANKTHFHNKGCAPSTILKVRVLELGSGLLSEII